MEYADDAVLPDKDTQMATQRLTNLDAKAQQEAGMKISIAKTKAQHIRSRPTVSDTTESDITNLPPEKQFKYVCDKCQRAFPTQHGLSVHKGRWCKGRPTAKIPSRKGSVADRIISRHKVEEKHRLYEKVRIGDEELENVYTFNYLGAETASDGDASIPVKHRCDVAWGHFNQYRKTLTSAKLSVKNRTRLYIQLIVMTMTHGSEAWMLNTKVKKMINSVNSKMLSQITKRSIHEEAKHPTFNVINHIKVRRFEYLGHILRLDNDRTLKSLLIQSMRDTAPFREGSLAAETPFQTKDQLVTAAQDRKNWRKLKAETYGESHTSLEYAASR